jgi:hypothetical protein
MQAIGAAENRLAPAGAPPEDHLRAALYDTMFAYAGTYSLEADKVTHHVDISWNESWTGADQIRHVEVAGIQLTLTMRVTDAASDTAIHYAVVWEKLAGLLDQRARGGP